MPSYHTASMTLCLSAKSPRKRAFSYGWNLVRPPLHCGSRSQKEGLPQGVSTRYLQHLYPRPWSSH
jgi:hypothetical protein